MASFDGAVLAPDKRAEVDKIALYMTALSLFNRLEAGMKIRSPLSAKYFSVCTSFFSDSFLMLEEFSSLFPI